MLSVENGKITREKEFFQYINTAVHRPIAGSRGATPVASPIQIQSVTQTPFVMCSTMAFVTTDAVGTAFAVANNFKQEPPVTVYWQATNLVWFNTTGNVNGMPLSSIYGYGGLPHYLKLPLVFANNSQFNVVACNLTAATDMYLWLTHEGYNANLPESA
jgi:hypothetical protein